MRAQNTGVPPRAYSSLQLRREHALQTAYQAFCKRIFASKYRRTNSEHLRRLVPCCIRRGGVLAPAQHEKRFHQEALSCRKVEKIGFLRRSFRRSRSAGT